MAKESRHESCSKVLEGAGWPLKELEDVGVLRDLSKGNIKGERGVADLFELGVRNLLREKPLRELMREVREGEIGESRQGSAREVWDLYREVESAIGSESAKDSV